jgi:hypothetical protein
MSIDIATTDIMVGFQKSSKASRAKETQAPENEIFSRKKENPMQVKAR